ncbi:MAG: RimK/LysX family protein [Deltaproteobacteria bacterium]|nr:RimK/LysX family protein [Deltaproteobacteria bacterium]
MKRKLRPPKVLIGWREWVELPSLGIERIKAKIDTGARTSALHADVVRTYHRAGRCFVTFRVHPTQRSLSPELEVHAEMIDERQVRSSSGKAELRPVILTTLQLGEERWPIEITLTRRDLMGFRMLLGRQALRRRVRIDPGRSFLLGRQSRT